jgi:hypothetical protein
LFSLHFFKSAILHVANTDILLWNQFDTRVS